MKIIDDGTTPEQDKHAYRFKEFGGLYTWHGHKKVWVSRPHLVATCADCGWTASFDLKLRGKTQLDLTHECVKAEVA